MRSHPSLLIILPLAPAPAAPQSLVADQTIGSAAFEPWPCPFWRLEGPSAAPATGPLWAAAIALLVALGLAVALWTAGDP